MSEKTKHSTCEIIHLFTNVEEPSLCDRRNMAKINDTRSNYNKSNNVNQNLLIEVLNVTTDEDDASTISTTIDDINKATATINTTSTTTTTTTSSKTSNSNIVDVKAIPNAIPIVNTMTADNSAIVNTVTSNIINSDENIKEKCIKIKNDSIHTNENIHDHKDCNIATDTVTIATNNTNTTAIVIDDDDDDYNDNGDFKKITDILTIPNSDGLENDINENDDDDDNDDNNDDDGGIAITTTNRIKNTHNINYRDNDNDNDVKIITNHQNIKENTKNYCSSNDIDNHSIDHDDEDDDFINVILNTSKTSCKNITEKILQVDSRVQSEMTDLLRQRIDIEQNNYIAVNYQEQLILVPQTHQLSMEAQKIIWPDNGKKFQQQDVAFLNSFNKYIHEMIEASCKDNVFEVAVRKYFETKRIQTAIKTEKIAIFSGIFKKSTILIPETMSTTFDVFCFHDFAVLILQNNQIVDYAVHGKISNVIECIENHNPKCVVYKSNGQDAFEMFLRYPHQPFHKLLIDRLLPLNISLMNNTFDTSDFCKNPNKFCAFCTGLNYLRRAVMNIKTNYYRLENTERKRFQNNRSYETRQNSIVHTMDNVSQFSKSSSFSLSSNSSSSFSSKSRPSTLSDTISNSNSSISNWTSKNYKRRLDTPNTDVSTSSTTTTTMTSTTNSSLKSLVLPKTEIKSTIHVPSTSKTTIRKRKVTTTVSHSPSISLSPSPSPSRSPSRSRSRSPLQSSSLHSSISFAPTTSSYQRNNQHYNYNYNDDGGGGNNNSNHNYNYYNYKSTTMNYPSRSPKSHSNFASSYRQKQQQQRQLQYRPYARRPINYRSITYSSDNNDYYDYKKTNANNNNYNNNFLYHNYNQKNRYSPNNATIDVTLNRNRENVNFSDEDVVNNDNNDGVVVKSNNTGNIYENDNDDDGNNSCDTDGDDYLDNINNSEINGRYKKYKKYSLPQTNRQYSTSRYFHNSNTNSDNNSRNENIINDGFQLVTRHYRNIQRARQNNHRQRFRNVFTSTHFRPYRRHLSSSKQRQNRKFQKSKHSYSSNRNFLH